jgi:murein DD-endopeptidase MepM/ murein hydrolase activator NlpD
MTAADMMALQFVLAALGCIVAGCAAWFLLALACRRWPALAMSRSAWLLAQLLTVAAFVAVLAPQRAELSVLPAIELTPAPQSTAVAPGPLESAPSAGPSETDDASGDWLVFAAQAWLLLYVAGVCVAGARLALAQRALRRLVQRATPVDDLGAHLGFAALPRPEVAVFETDLAISPMLVGVWRPLLLLPRHLRDFDPIQQQMIVAHELTHLRRRDPLWMAASIAAQTVLWFNPAMRQLGERLTWAQELGCDRQVLAGRVQPQRQAYAAALVSQLKLQRVAFGGALAFGGFNGATLSARIMMIRHGGGAALGTVGRSALLLGFGAVFAASLALQPAFAWRIPDVPASPGPAQVEWRAPLERPRVSSFFGVVSPLRPHGHRGIDFAARTGTPVLASADGKVVSSTDLDAGGAKFGKTILVAHANGLESFYAHLDRRVVAGGDFVKAGQVIGMSGATGKVTGPHLHFEVRQAGHVTDPQSVLAGLEAGATASSLRARAANKTSN